MSACDQVESCRCYSMELETGLEVHVAKMLMISLDNALHCIKVHE